MVVREPVFTGVRIHLYDIRKIEFALFFKSGERSGFKGIQRFFLIRVEKQNSAVLFEYEKTLKCL